MRTQRKFGWCLYILVGAEAGLTTVVLVFKMKADYKRDKNRGDRGAEDCRSKLGASQFGGQASD